MEKKLFKVKKESLTYNEFVDFLSKTLALVRDDDGSVLILSRQLIFKIMFAKYYLDVELPSGEVEAYEIIKDINYEDYKDKIAWNQFKDLEVCYNKYCDESNRIANKTINDAIVELVMSVTELIDKANKEMEELDFKDTLKLMGEFKDSLGNLDTEKAMEFFLKKSIEESKKEELDQPEDMSKENKELN